MLRLSSLQPRLHEEHVAKISLTWYIAFENKNIKHVALCGLVFLIFLYFLSTDRTHWPDSDNYFFTLEATGYALLALIKSGHMEEAAAPFQWLSEKRGIGGGYGSTQVKTMCKPLLIVLHLYLRYMVIHIMTVFLPSVYYGSATGPL